MAPLCLLLVAILSAVSASAENATITPMERPLFMWQRDSAMTLEITATDGDALPLQYTVIPLTASLGLNQSELDRGVRTGCCIVAGVYLGVSERC